MESCLGELHLQNCIVYLDDIIIFSKTSEKHLHWLRLVFQKISEAGLKLKPSKCEFFRTRLEYLGHIMSEKGIETNPKKVQVTYGIGYVQLTLQRHTVFLDCAIITMQVYQRLR